MLIFKAHQKEVVMVLRDRDNYAAKTFPVGLLVISTLYWPVVWFLMLWYLKALTLSFAHSYADAVLPEYYPLTILGFSVVLPFLILLIKMEINKNSMWSFFYIHLFAILSIGLCLSLYYVLTFPIRPFTPHSIIGEASLFMLKPLVMKISTIALTLIPGILGNCFILQNEFKTLNINDKRNVIKAWTGGLAAAVPAGYFFTEAGGFLVLALIGNLVTIKEIMKYLVNRQNDTFGTDQ